MRSLSGRRWYPAVLFNPDMGLGVLMGIIVEPPSAPRTPCKDPVVGSAPVHRIEDAGGNVVPGDIEVHELLQQFSGESGRASEDHRPVILHGHHRGHEFYPREGRKVERQAVAAFHPDAGDLPGRGGTGEEQKKPRREYGLEKTAYAEAP